MNRAQGDVTGEFGRNDSADIESDQTRIRNVKGALVHLDSNVIPSQLTFPGSICHQSTSSYHVVFYRAEPNSSIRAQVPQGVLDRGSRPL